MIGSGPTVGRCHQSHDGAAIFDASAGVGRFPARSRPGVWPPGVAGGAARVIRSYRV